MKPDGGPAFPYQPGDWAVDNTGMTLRDYFAGQALIGILHDEDGLGSPLFQFHLRAEAAYKMADAMLAERAK